ncbi:MAG: DUF1402 family protein [Aliihoeflea sp.]
MIRAIGLALSLSIAFSAIPAWAQVKVPPGNRNVEQPAIPGGSASRTRAMATTYEGKYQRVMRLFRQDDALRSKIRQVSAQYGIDPVHMAGAIIGEHTYNVDAYDRLQTYYVKAVSYLSTSFQFGHGGELVAAFVARPQFSECDTFSDDSYDLWACRERVWDAKFRGKTVDGTSFPDNRFGAVFFQPFYAGQTFGIGQLNPLTALQMSDMVHRVSGLPRLDASDPQAVYRTIIDPDLTLAYVAATLKTSIEAYRHIAGFDISDNPGVTSTLYNIGSPEERARRLKRENEQRRASGQRPRLPEENYYGWLVNDRIDDLNALF